MERGRPAHWVCASRRPHPPNPLRGANIGFADIISGAERGVGGIGANLSTALLLVGSMGAEDEASVDGLVWSSTRGVAEIASQREGESLEGEEVEGTADSGEDGFVPEDLPAPSAEGMVGVVEPGIEGDRGSPG